MKYPIPPDALKQNVVALGKTGAGKSSVMRLIIEAMLDDHMPVCILDPKGDWWGIKLSADGKKPGYPLVIFGGKHADIPINEHAGAHIAELFATGNRPCVVDLRGWMPGARTKFFIEFASTLFQRNVGRRWLVIDECHNFAPKGKVLDPDAGRMLHWANRLASEGRSLGVTLLGLSQRPQKVHNDFLTSCETLIALRVLHASDRGAYKDWIDGCGDPAKGKEMLATIANLQRGSGYVWSPEIGFGPELVKFPMFKTYDSFKPQEASDAVRLTGWAAVNLDEIKSKLATFVKEAEENDPKALHGKIVVLNRELRAALKRAEDAAKRAQPAPAPTKIERIEVPTVGKRALEGLRKSEANMRRMQKAIQGIHKETQLHAEAIGNAIDKLTAELAKIRRVDTNIHIAAPKPAPPQDVNRSVSTIPPKFPNLNHGWKAGELPSPQQRILDAIAWFEALGITEPPLVAVAFMAGYVPTGGAFTNPRGNLRASGLIEYRGDRLALTEAGRHHARFPAAAGTNEELHQRVLERLPGPERKLLTVLIEAYPAMRPDVVLAERTGYAPTGGAFTNPKGRLRTLGLATYPQPKHVRAADILFPIPTAAIA